MDAKDATVSDSVKIYLDVSSTAVTPIITGIPRVVRALAEKLDQVEIQLIEFNGLTNSYKHIDDLPPLHTSTESLRKSRRTIAATKLYKVLTENESIGSTITFLLRNRIVFYVARRLLGSPSANGETLRDIAGIVFLPEVPVHNLHLKKILKLKESGAIKIALYVHDLLPLQHPQYFSRDLVWKFNKYVPLIEAADIIIVSNEDVRNQVVERFQKSHVRIAALPSSYPPSIPSMHPRSSFLAVGTIEPRKNYMAILDAFERLHALHPNVELRIIGNLGWKYTDIVSRISRLQERGVRLIWLKNLSDRELQREYQEALALLYPSHFEGYGLPVVEALSQSTPVITSDRPALRLFRRFGGVRVINPDNRDELFNEMVLMLDSKHRDSLVEQIQLSEIPTSWQAFTDQCYATLKEV